MSHQCITSFVDALGDIGLTYVEHVSRDLNDYPGGTNLNGSTGVLKNPKHVESVLDHVDELLKLANDNGVYLLLEGVIGVKDVWAFSYSPQRVYSDELVAIIFPKEALQDVKRESLKVQDAIKRNFWYWQEKVKIVRVMSAVETAYKSIDCFCRQAYMPSIALENADALKKGLSSGQHIFSEVRNVRRYMDDECSQEAAERFCRAVRFFGSFN